MAQGGKVLSFKRMRPQAEDWTQQELAEFYRVESALLQSGLVVSCDRGLSDEGDPWFVFCLSETEEIIAHFARIDGWYLVVSTAFSGVARGRDFRAMIRELMDSHPLMLPRNHGAGQKIFLHPAALLAALVATSYLVSTENCAAFQNISESGRGNGFGISFHFRTDFAIVATVALAVTLVEPNLDFPYTLNALTPEIDSSPTPGTSHLSYMTQISDTAIDANGAPTHGPDSPLAASWSNQGQTDGADWALPSLKLDIVQSYHSTLSTTNAVHSDWLSILSGSSHVIEATSDGFIPPRPQELVTELPHPGGSIHVLQPSLTGLHNPSGLAPTNTNLVSLDGVFLSNESNQSPIDVTLATSNSPSPPSLDDGSASPDIRPGLTPAQSYPNYHHFYSHYFGISSHQNFSVNYPLVAQGAAPPAHHWGDANYTASQSLHSEDANHTTARAQYSEDVTHSGAVNHLAIYTGYSSLIPSLSSASSNIEDSHSASQNHSLRFAEDADPDSHSPHTILGILTHTHLHSA